MENIQQIPNIQPVQSVEPISPIKNQNIFKYLFIASIIVLLGVIIGFYFILNNKTTKLSDKQTEDIASIPTAIPTTEKNSIIPTKTEVDPTKELTMLLNPTNKPNFIISVSKIIGNYATGGAGFADDSGFGWTAVKVNGVWKIVHQGQDGMACDIVYQYQIPKEIYGSCQ